MGDGERWRSLLGHDGFFVVRLQLHAPAQGGRDRAVASGFRADWVLPDGGPPARGPLDFVDDVRSIKPGETARVRVYPLQTERWRDVGPGTELALWRRGARSDGVGMVEERVGVPEHAVPLRLDGVKHRGVLLRRREPWLQRARRRIRRP